VAVAQLGFRDLFDVEEGVVLVAQVARGFADSKLLRQTSAERVSTRHDDTVFDAKLEERVAEGVDLSDEVLVRNGNLAVLVTALFLVRDLVFDLEGAGT